MIFPGQVERKQKNTTVDQTAKVSDQAMHTHAQVYTCADTGFSPEGPRLTSCSFCLCGVPNFCFLFKYPFYTSYTKKNVLAVDFVKGTGSQVDVISNEEAVSWCVKLLWKLLGNVGYSV